MSFVSLRSAAFSALLVAGLASVSAQAAEVIRYKTPNSNFPIAAAVEIPASVTVVNLSGKVPGVVDKSAPANSRAAYGNTETQTTSVLKSIEQQLKDLGLSMSDVVKMTVFLVGDAEMGGKMDFEGFMKGYTKFFGTPAQPNLPSRSVVQVAGLASSAWLVEIEVTAVRK